MQFLAKFEPIQFPVLMVAAWQVNRNKICHNILTNEIFFEQTTMFFSNSLLRLSLGELFFFLLFLSAKCNGWCGADWDQLWIIYGRVGATFLTWSINAFTLNKKSKIISAPATTASTQHEHPVHSKIHLQRFNLENLFDKYT